MATKLDKDAKRGRNEPGYGNARVITADEYFKRVHYWQIENKFNVISTG